MEILTLDSGFQPNGLVESYESCIWTERYSKNGDFQVTGDNVGELMAKLPLESYVTLRESTVPMVVELYKIEKKKQAAPKITITGRSFDTVLERRAAVKTLLADGTVRTAWLVSASKSSDAAYLAMRTVLGDGPRYQNGVAILPAIAPAVMPEDAIPEVDLTLPADFQIAEWSGTLSYTQGNLVGLGTSIYQATSLSPNFNKSPDTNPTYWTLVTNVPAGTDWGDPGVVEIQPKNLYSAVSELIDTNHRGIKAVRPELGGSKSSLEIYNGANLTVQVVFESQFDQIDDATYLLSNQGSTNVGYVYGPNGGTRVLRTTITEPSGLSRRVLLLDLASDNTVNSPEARNSRGLIELYKNNPTALFDGEVAPSVASGYNTKYNLGDIVTLRGDYGLSQIVRVAEFIRSSDSSGYKAYPAFETIE